MAGFGGAVKLTGETEYQRALKGITQNLTVLSSEMKVVTSMYDKNDTSTENLAKQNEVLKKKLDEQNKSLAEAKKMLDQAKNSTESNEATVLKWQNAVNKAQAEVNKTTRELEANTKMIDKNENAVDDLGDSIEDTGKKAEQSANGGFTVFKGILANLGTQVINSVIDGIKRLAGAVVDLGKQAIQSYAEYEQLVGGVETLFKDSSGIVQDYANNAYKTAGLSANEYMNTVTSFSASLLQSLNGDTAKSAEVADMAITDMSDNANKMGTSMDMIQNAYQGFAKQNYTMLDNLKLGYGGTKTEMERLLKDATAISGVEYDISNLNDVYQAIHIIQGELGITGTTAKEASETISGSIASMKSAWQNLLTGLADGNADFDLLINNFVDGIMTVADNIMPLIPTIISGMGVLAYNLITQLVPQIASQIPQLINDTLPMIIQALDLAISSILSVLPQLLQAFQNIIPQLLNTLATMLPQLIDAGVQIILSLALGIAQSLPTLIPAIIDAILTIVDNLISNIDLIVDAGIQLIIGLAQGLIDAIPIIVEKMPIIIENLITAIYRNFGKLVNAGIQLIIQLGLGLIKAIPQLISYIPRIISSIFNGLINGIPQMIQAGGELLAGLFKGLLDPRAIWNAVKSLFKGIIGGIKSLFGIHSPSKVFEDEVGKNLALGLGAGFEDTMSSVTDQMASAVPTNFDINANANIGATQTTSNFANMVDAFKQALKEVNIVLDDEVAGRFVTDTVERVVYS